MSDHEDSVPTVPNTMEDLMTDVIKAALARKPRSTPSPSSDSSLPISDLVCSPPLSRKGSSESAVATTSTALTKFMPLHFFSRENLASARNAQKSCDEESLSSDISERNSMDSLGSATSSGKLRPAYDIEDWLKGDCNEREVFDPMKWHYDQDVGITGDDFTMAATGFGNDPFKERDIKDVPCKFHDGVSGTCWKGKECKYGHEMNTGGVYAKQNPSLAFAAGLRTQVADIDLLPEKPRLHREAELSGMVTSIVNPSEFYITLANNDECACICKKVDDLVEFYGKEERNVDKPDEASDPMYDYFFGFTAMEMQEGFVVKGKAIPSTPLTLDEVLQDFMTSGNGYRALQNDVYLKEVELVAVRNEEGQWKRALVVVDMPDLEEGTTKYRVQLLDTGEKLTVSHKDICRLTQRFCASPPKAFKCCLYGISPVLRTWHQEAIQVFKDLVLNKPMKIIVKTGIPFGPKCKTKTFESHPYAVRLLFGENDKKYVDVSQRMLDAGLGMEWHPFPFRPFIATKISTKGFHFFRKPVPDKLPPSALELENSRLAWQKHVEDYKSYQSESEMEMFSSDSSAKWQRQFKIRLLKQMNEDAERCETVPEVEELEEGEIVVDKLREPESSPEGSVEQEVRTHLEILTEELEVLNLSNNHDRLPDANQN